MLVFVIGVGVARGAGIWGIALDMMVATTALQLGYAGVSAFAAAFRPQHFQDACPSAFAGRATGTGTDWDSRTWAKSGGTGSLPFHSPRNRAHLYQHRGRENHREQSRQGRHANVECRAADFKEVAEIVGISEATVKTRMFYARKKLTQIVQEPNASSFH